MNLSPILKKHMKIAYFTDQYWPSISGVSVSVDAFAKELTNMGHEVFLFVPDYPGASESDTLKNRQNIFRFRSHKVPFNDENRIVHKSEKKNIFKILNSIKPDIIHTHTEFSLGKIGSKYARMNKIPLVMTCHTNWEELIGLYVPLIPTWLARPYCRYFMRKNYRKADIIIVPTSLMEVLLNLYFIFKPIRVIPTGIDHADFEYVHHCDEVSVSNVYKEFPVLEGKKFLFFAGRLGMEKNIEFLIDVLKNLALKHPSLYLVIAGDGPARKDLENYVSEKGLKEKVIFTGFVEREKLKDFYSSSNVFVFASKVESQGLVTLESMACGTPVVAIGKMGTREVMGGDSGGFMVDDDMDLFVEKTDLLLSDFKVCQAKSEEAERHADRWTIQAQAVKMERLYLSLHNKFSH